MTVLNDIGEIPPVENVTEHHRYLLPPPAADRYSPTFNHQGRYKLKHPKTDKAQTFMRASTLAKVLDDTYHLDKWKLRNVLHGMSLDPNLGARVLTAIESEAKAGVVDAIAEDAQVAAGSAEAREFGTAVHAWAEEVDAGRILPSQVPEMYREHVINYLQVLARHALVALPEYTERIVFNTKAGAVGTLDRIYLCADGTLALGDVKTSKSLTYTYLSYAIQLDIYAEADFMLSLDGTTWEPMPELRKDFAILMHVPSDNAQGASAVTYDLKVAAAALSTAVLVKKLRAEAPKAIPNIHPIPIPSAEYARQQAAVLAIRLSTCADDVSAAWEEFQDVWTDDLTDLGTSVVNALTENENAS